MDCLSCFHKLDLLSFFTFPGIQYLSESLLLTSENVLIYLEASQLSKVHLLILR